MDARDLFLEQHAAMHSVAVGGNKMSMAERSFAGLTDQQMRVRPRDDLNSLAWLMWHIARAEDVFVNRVLTAGAAVFDGAWQKRLAVGRVDFGIGMTSAEVSELSREIDLAALRGYRDAVGLRTRRRFRNGHLNLAAADLMIAALSGRRARDSAFPAESTAGIGPGIR